MLKIAVDRVTVELCDSRDYVRWPLTREESRLNLP